MNVSPALSRRPRTLAVGVVDTLSERIRSGKLEAGAKLPTEAEIMEEFGVSRTVVREAISKLQAAGLVRTRHGVGTFVVGVVDAPTFRIDVEQLATVRDVIAVLELRISLETEAAALAAVRRTEDNLAAMREALDAFAAAVESEGDTVQHDFRFHLEIARATQNPHFSELMGYVGTLLIPRTRVNTARAADTARQEYLRRVNGEHESIINAITNQDPEGARAAMRTHLANSRERLRRAQTAAAS
ncbi:FadR/GntR family transcriptional regulator [Caldimonas tepidiphila]|uniref:FadR/GntR family transcriptional regulator n=1 Tax=Caldimonas tepidiphila TaxID=2315841 RepID=UPI000E5BD0EE|nr:FadR/GntR family transcriptional regulator [Caldimonas tepidiphila]